MGIEFLLAMKRRGWVRIAGAACFAATLCLIPGYCISIHNWKPSVPLTDALQQDLLRLGGDRLQNQVQCMDMVAGCLGALYRLNLVQNTGFMGDYMFFGPPGSQPSPLYRQMFLDHFHENPPSVIVVTTARLGLDIPDSFDKINQWPEFVDLLNSDYTLDVTRMPDPDKSRGYRIYLLRPDARVASLP
jgi:hypothetical protein